jgi:hypothetical protein
MGSKPRTQVPVKNNEYQILDRTFFVNINSNKYSFACRVLAKHPVAPVANMEVQSASVETFGLKMTQELDIMFSIACTLERSNFILFVNFKCICSKKGTISNILQKVITYCFKNTFQSQIESNQVLKIENHSYVCLKTYNITWVIIL